MRNHIGADEYDYHLSIVRSRDLNGKTHHVYMILIKRKVPIWESHKSQSSHVRPWGNATIGGELLVDLPYSSQRDVCQGNYYPDNTKNPSNQFYRFYYGIHPV